MYLSSHHKMEVSLDLLIQHVIKCMCLQSRDSNTQIMSSYEWVFRDCGHEWDSNIRVSKDPPIHTYMSTHSETRIHRSCRLMSGSLETLILD